MKNSRLSIICGLALAAVVAASGAATARPDVRNMTCQQARDLVVQSHSIVLTTGQHTYDKFVSGQRYCEHPLTAVPAYVTTKDVRQCMIGYTCEDRDPIFDGD